MAKRAKVLGFPIGNRRSSKIGSWARSAAVLGGGAYAVTRAIRDRRQNGGSALQKGREALGKAADAAEGDQPPKTAYLIDEYIDVGVNRHEVYNQWTQFEDFSQIMKAVENVDHRGGKATWSAKIGPARRQWEAEITDQVPDKRIAWKAEGQVNLHGVVTFHSLDEDLTRVLVEMVYRPTGFVEKVGNVFRAARFRVRRDLKLFKSHVELGGETSERSDSQRSNSSGTGGSAKRSSTRTRSGNSAA
jgi:uncharacterized membrane protein